ncbi:phosphatase PAP2 family protein [Streptomyces baarnensis]|uniref:phosphatase PAP2 family protein n=1 Tax=Streptomyces TaxID=1883 RepID=UPI0029AC2993|nr:phosphatase PAP2 family protein [Streptomyces sp. ME02-6979.5a]MDX3342586.1 phosphatase PAP2 family protein [Streptomyces sp. ME02-6979.5a]
MFTVIRSARARSGRQLVAAACTALFIAVVYSLAVWTHFGQELENDLLRPDNPVPPAPPLGSSPMEMPEPGPNPESPTVVILPSGQAAVWGGLLLLVPLVRGKVRPALWGLVTLAGSAATATVLKSLLPRPPLDLSAGLPAGNSAPSGHATMATALALVALVVCPAALRYVAASAAVVVAVLTAYFVQGANWHRPSDILMGAATALLCAFLASVLVPAAGADIAAERGNPWRTSLCLLAVTAAALWWVPEPLGSPAYLVFVSATAPCAVAVLTASVPRPTAGGGTGGRRAPPVGHPVTGHGITPPAAARAGPRRAMMERRMEGRARVPRG